jgi:hypothetical protein
VIEPDAVREAAAEQRASSPPSDDTAPGGVRPNDRVIVFGASTAGKSEVINHLFSTFRVQRVLVDTKGHEFDVIGPDGQLLEPVSDVAAIDWREPIVHYVDRTGQVEEFGELFDALNRRHHVMTFVHETADLCEYRPNKSPRPVMAYLNKGAAHGRGFIGGSQRAVYVPLHARTEAMHVFYMVPRLVEDDDHRAAASAFGMHPNELAGQLADLHHEHGDYSFLWADRRARTVRACPPLPEHVRAQSIVRRRTVVA